ncbi:hypothetical protein FACUT_2271 [Fusarium acutatum]|uniref:Fungal N-terminal domain-containing protein n=1 Tax=Fusarium acutatum TaxID=78861 RepID=A0A8H4K3C2_9HYPO|nr:hypothetical protein FACUT_2271 [Fusarium acutatum]
MAEGAGTAIGIISFGLQLYTGLSEYLDAVKGREEDLLQAKNNARTLQCSLKAIEDTLSKVNGNTIVQDAVEECKSSCESELTALHKLLSDLQGKPINPADPISRAKSSMQKWSYPFKKKNIARLEERLKSANNVLKTALSALQLAILNDQSTAILSLQQTMETILVQTESTSRTTQFPKFNTKIDEILTHLRSAETVQTQVAQLVSYPEDLRILCDAVSNVSLRSEPPNSHTTRSITGQRGRAQELCNCAKRQAIRRRRARLGLIYFETELKRITHHAPECSLSQVVTTTEQKRNVVGVSIPNILNILTSAVGVSISLTTGAGGFSLAQNITWSPTVDESLSPAFKLVRALCDLKIWTEPSLGKKEYEMIAKSCVRRLHLCYANRQASPLDMNSNGESVLDILASGMQNEQSLGNEAADDVAFVFRSLATIEVPITYDRDGNLRFLSFVLESAWLLNTNTLPETMSALLSRCGESTRHDYSSVRGFDRYPQRRSILKEFPQVAQSLGFNSLSIAVLREDEDDVRFLIKRYPSFRMEVNYCGQSPVHVAVLVGNLDILSLVIKDNNPDAINTMDMSQETPKSVYTYILDRETAEYAFSLGFDRETAFIDVFRRITNNVIQRGGHGWPSPWYIDWMLQCGADLASTVPPDFVPGVVNPATWAHYLMSVLGYKARYYPYRLYDNILPQSVANTAFSEVLGDDCRCHCSLQGCTPLIKFLEGLGCRRRFPRTWFTLTEAIRSFVASIQALIAGEHVAQSWMPRAVLRYATFCALGLRHTCCKHAHGGYCSSMDSEEIDEIHEEDSATLQQLEDLVTHFGNGYGSMTTLDAFLKEVWLPKMQEVYREMVSYHITEEELRKAEDCGVKLAIADSKPILWCEPPEPPKGSDCSTKVDVDEPEGFPDIVPIGLDGWMGRLDEIAIDPDRPVVVTPASSSTIAMAQTGV